MTVIEEIDWLGEPAQSRFILRDYQQAAKDAIESGWHKYSRQLLDMATGTGKSSLLNLVAAKAVEEGGRALLLQNRDQLVRMSARRVFDETGIECEIEMAGETASPFAPIVVASVPTICRPNRLSAFSDRHFSCVIADECFPAGTNVDGRCISKLKIGEMVRCFNHKEGVIELRPIIKKFRSIPKRLMSVRFRNGTSIACTPKHPFFCVAKNEYVPAWSLTSESMVLCTTYEPTTKNASRCHLHQLQVPFHDLLQRAKSVHKERNASLLFANVPRRKCASNEFGNNEANQYNKCCGYFSPDEGEKSHEHAGGKGENEDNAAGYGMEAAFKNGKRHRTNSTSIPDGVRTRLGYGSGRKDDEVPRLWIPKLLQARCWKRGTKNWGRDRRYEPYVAFQTGSGPEEGSTFNFVGVDCVEIYESGCGGQLKRLCPDGFVYNIEVEGHHNYFANGVLVHNCHHSVSPSYNRVLNYFHYGAESLAEDWMVPDDGTYQPISRVLGCTATPQLAGRKQLGEFYQHVAYSYQLIEAVRDGWLVPPVAVMEPLPVNLRGLRAKRGPNGLDYNPTEVAERMVPIIEELAKLFVRVASDRKTMAFMPSVNTARMLADAMERNGLKSVFVSGECLDRNEKTLRFEDHGPGIALVTSAMYVEGYDCVDVDCVFAGITRSAPYHRQKVGRATRPLKGVVEGLATAAERRAAIAASAKKTFLIVDPFCRCDDIDLCDAYDLFAEKPEIKKLMKETGEQPSEELAKRAERDFLKSIEKEARKAAQKRSRVIDPLAWATSLSQEKLASYKPEKAWELKPVSAGQKQLLGRFHVDVSKVPNAGLANKMISIILTRSKAGLANPMQLDFLHRLGVSDEDASRMTEDEARAKIDGILKR